MPAIRIPLRVTPKASRDEIIGWRNKRLAVKVTAPPVDGAANEAVVKLLSKLLKLRASDMTIVSGHSSRDKVIAVSGCGKQELLGRISEAQGK